MSFKRVACLRVRLRVAAVAPAALLPVAAAAAYAEALEEVDALALAGSNT